MVLEWGVPALRYAGPLQINVGSWPCGDALLRQGTECHQFSMLGTGCIPTHSCCPHHQVSESSSKLVSRGSPSAAQWSWTQCSLKYLSLGLSLVCLYSHTCRMEIHSTKQVSNLQRGCWDFLYLVSTQEGEDLVVTGAVECNVFG